MAARALTLLLALAIIGGGSRTHAWREAGHQAVALIAEARLLPQARAEVARLLRGESMAGVSLWADEVRNTTHRQSNAWHAVSIPLDARAFDRRRDCGNGDCAVAAIERLEAVLGDPGAAERERQEALKFVIHFVADIHQPLHAVSGGGSDREANLGGETDLHGVWDSGVIVAGGRTAQSLAAAATALLGGDGGRRLEGGVPAGEVPAGGGPADWANESFRLALDVAFPQLRDGTIDASERRDAMGVIDRRVAQAGVRLAALLNRTLAGNDRR